jgi:hypothetical protein
LGFKIWWWFRYFSSKILISCPMRLWQKAMWHCKWDMSTCTILCCFWHHKGFSVDTQQLRAFQSLVYHSTVRDLFEKNVIPYSPVIMCIKYNSKNIL